MNTVEALAVVREALGLPFIAAGGTELHGRAFAALALIEDRVEELAAEADALEAERDEARRINEFDIHVVVAELRRERDELEAALRGIQGWIESEFREGDKEFQVALAACRALGGGE